MLNYILASLLVAAIAMAAMCLLPNSIIILILALGIARTMAKFILGF